MSGAYTRSTGMGGEHRAAAEGRRGGGAATATKPAMGTGGGPPVVYCGFQPAPGPAEAERTGRRAKYPNARHTHTDRPEGCPGGAERRSRGGADRPPPHTRWSGDRICGVRLHL